MNGARGWGSMTAAERKAESKRRRKVAERNKAKRLNGGGDYPDTTAPQIEVLKGEVTVTESAQQEHLQEILDWVKRKYYTPMGWYCGNKMMQLVVTLYALIHEE